MADKDEEIARLKARVAELEGTGRFGLSCRSADCVVVCMGARAQWWVALGGGLSGGRCQRQLWAQSCAGEGALPVLYGERVLFQSVVRMGRGCCSSQLYVIWEKIMLLCCLALSACPRGLDVSRVLLAVSTVRLPPAPHSVCGASRRRPLSQQAITRNLLLP